MTAACRIVVRMDEQRFDVVVIGGGPAGLSGALVLARSRRSVVVLDTGEPRNAPADGAHNVLTRDGVPPRELLRLGREEVRGYGVEVVDARATGATREDDGGFGVTTEAGATYRARRVLLATGLTDELPAVDGLRERWGREVIHCPYCHGYEHADEAIVVLGGAFGDLHRALLFRQLSDDVTLLVAPGREPAEEDAALLDARGIAVVVGDAEALEVHGDALRAVRLRDGRAVGAQAVAVAPRFVANAGLLAGLGLRPEPHPMGAAVGEQVPATPTGATAVPGLYVAGNVSDLMAQVATSMHQGAWVGAQINADLVMEEAQRALHAHETAAA